MTTEKSVIEQPPANMQEQQKVKRYVGGSARSVERLEILKFDPIENLVNDYHEIQELIALEYKYRDAVIVRMHPSTGKAMAWYPDMLDKLLDKRMRISSELMRYGYGRVPETNTLEVKEVPKFGVVLT